MYRANHSDAQTQLVELIAHWIRSDLSASWDGLANALSMIGKYGTATAENFRQAVGQPPGNMCSPSKQVYLLSYYECVFALPSGYQPLVPQQIIGLLLTP